MLEDTLVQEEKISLLLSDESPRLSQDPNFHIAIEGLAYRPLSTWDRLIIPFHSTEFCQVGTGFVEEESNCPQILVERGVNPQIWKRYLSRMASEVQSRQISVCSHIGCVCCICCCYVPYSCLMKSYHGALQKWLDDFNEEVFQLDGMFIKFQSCLVDATKSTCMHRVNNDRGAPPTTDGNKHACASWLAVALTPQQSKALQREQVLWSMNQMGTLIVTRHEVLDDCVVKRVV